MNPIQEIYLSVLRSFVQNSTPMPVEAEQWGELMELAYIHNTRGILCHVYRSHPDLAPDSIQPFLRQQCIQEIAAYAQRAQGMRHLAAEFDRNGIPCIYFKGFVVRDYYPVPELRTFGDVDFVIPKEFREKSHALMESLGYTPEDTWEPAYSYRKGAEYYEIHTDVMEINVSDKADYPAYFSKLWDHVRPAQVVKLENALEFTPEFHLLYLLTHIAKHISSSGAGIRMYLDIAFFIRQLGTALDWDWVRRELEKLRLDAFANMVFTCVERWFGVESPLPLKPVPEAVMADFLEFTLAGGVYGYAGRDKGTVFLKQHSRNADGEVSRFKTLLHHALPPVKSLENRYPYLQKHPWLLPGAWIQRLLDSRKEWGRFADHTREILSADEEEVRKLKRIYKEIGL